MSNPSNEPEHPDRPEVGVGDDQLPEDLQPGEDNPLAEGLDPGEQAGDLLEEGKEPEQDDGTDGTDEGDEGDEGDKTGA